MKENEVEEKWNMIVSMLKGANDAGAWAFWREQLGCTHPDHNTEEVDNPTQYAAVCFHAAKKVYCIHKDQLDRFHARQDSPANMPRTLSPRNTDCELFNAMKRVVEEEMAAQLEEQILIAEEPQGYWEGDEYLPLPESNDIEFDLNSY